MPLFLSGIGVSRGIVIGRVHRMAGADLDIPEYGIEPAEVEQEIERYNAALNGTRSRLRSVRERIPASVQADIASFIDTHLLMLDDHAITEAVVDLIRERQCNAEWALRLQRDNLTAVFEEMDDAYLRSRRDDVEHVVASILRVLLKQERVLETHSREQSSDGDSEPMVLVADNVTPADIILLQQQGVAAFITEFGGPLSHTAILAKSLGLASIVGMHHARRYFRDGELVVVDGEAGHAIASPDQSALEYYQHCQQRDERYRRMLGRLRDTPAVSTDGAKITLLGNVELPGDAIQLSESGAEGIGLFRTEFLYMNREQMPDEDEQFEAYSAVLKASPGPVTIRTLDLGADKQVDGGRTDQASNNPALGLRAIRLCLREQDMFRVQLRALLRASAVGDVRIMLPMISNLQELRQARQLIDQTRAELKREGQQVADEVPVGAMIEVPAAALAAPMLARHADFFSIGTNDLIQYTLAIDRVDDEVNYLYDPLHPAVLRLIRMTIEAGIQAGIPVAMCGEMASDRRYTRLLLGLGLTEFSMHPASILEVKQIILNSDIGALNDIAGKALNAVSATELHEFLSQLEQNSSPAAAD